MAVNRQRGLLQVATNLGVSVAPRTAGIEVPSDGAAQAASAAASASDAIARDFAQIGKEIGAYADHAAAVEGERAGKLAGMDPEFRPSGAITIRGQAFDRAGLQVYGQRVSLEVENDIDAGGNLDAKKAAWLRKTPEELHPEIDLRFRRGALVQARQATRAHAERISAEAISATAAEVDSAVKRLHQTAYAMGLDGTADAAIAAQIDLVTKAVTRLGPDGKPIVSAAKASKLISDARQDAVNARLQGTFSRLATPEEKIAFAEKFEQDWQKGEGLAKNYDLDGFQRMAGVFRQDIKGALSQRKMAVSVVLGEIDRVVHMAEKGAWLSRDQMAGVEARVAAVSDPTVAQALAVAKSTNDFVAVASKLPPAVIRQQAELATAKVRDPSLSIEEKTFWLARKELAAKLASSTEDGLARDQLVLANERGVVALPPLDLSSPEAAQASMTARIAAADEGARHYGIAPKYLTQEEARQYAVTAAQGGAGLMAVSERLVQAAAKRAPAVLAQLKDVAPVVAHLGAHIAALGPTQVARDAADGIALMKTDVKLPKPSAAELNLAAKSVIGDLLSGRPDDERAVIDLALAAYQVDVSRKHGVAGAAVAAFDRSLFAAKLKAFLGERKGADGATYGGVAPSQKGALWGGSNPIIVPPFIRNDGIPDLIETIRLDDLAEIGAPMHGDGRPVSLADFRRARLVQTGATTFAFDLGTAERPAYLRRADGEHFALDIKKVEPVLRQRRPDLFWRPQ